LEIVITLVAFLVTIVVLILAHELGHFVTAKAFGVGVIEFGLGFPPRLVGIKWGETLYSLNLILLGGFVKLAGEEDPSVPNSLAGKSIKVRLLVLAAGSLMNFLLPILLFSIAFMVPHQIVSGQVLVEEVAPASPAAEAGFRSGDIVTTANDKPVNNTSELTRLIQLNLGKEMAFSVQHSDGTKEDIQVIPRWKPPEGQGAVGIAVSTANWTLVREQYPFWRAIPMGMTSSIETFILFKNGIGSMIIGTAPVELAGPVGIAQITGEVAQAGLSPLLEFAAFLSINLAIINIFPLPAFDGGRIAFVLLEWIRRGKRIPARTESMIHFIGFLLLMAFFVAITYQDIARIISGESLLP
jgi:regulator of sigma E protease